MLDEHDINLAVYKKTGDFLRWMPDYCNDPIVAFPVILNNNISLVAPDGEHNLWDAIYGDILIQDSNPLRAAMIAYTTGD